MDNPLFRLLGRYASGLLILSITAACPAAPDTAGSDAMAAVAGTCGMAYDPYDIAMEGMERAVAMVRGDSVDLESFVGAYYYLLYNVPCSYGYYSALCKTNAARDTVKLWAEGVAGWWKSGIKVVCRRYYPAMERMKAVVMSRGCSKLDGDIDIDGRDWDAAKMSFSSGVPGIYTCDTIECGPGVAIGGPDSMPTPPQKGIIPGTVQTGADSALFPRLPESVFCLDSGAFDTYKTPLSACPLYAGGDTIIYWEASRPVVALWGRGVIICHNADYSASLKNLHGSFEGIIIADKIDRTVARFNFTGVIITLSNSAVNMFGNGITRMQYCSQTVKKYVEKYSHPVVDIVSWSKLY
jgi:hypothetical protein